MSELIGEVMSTAAGTFFVRRRKSASDRTLFLLHGGFQTGLCWRKVADLLPQDLSIVIPDLPGLGATPTPAGGYTMPHIAKCVFALADTLGCDEIALAGHDLGAGVAAAMAIEAPARVSSLVFVDMLVPGFGFEDAWVPRPEGKFLWFAALNSAPDVIEVLFDGRESDYLRLVLEKTVSDFSAFDEHDLDEYLSAYSGPEGLAPLGGYFRAMWDNASWFQERVSAGVGYAGPAHAIGGQFSTGDFALHSLKAVIPQTEGTVAEGAGHWLPEERPELVATVIATSMG